MRGNGEMKDFGDMIGPGEDEVVPAIMDLQMKALRLCPGLMQEVEFASVVEFPDDSVARKESRVGDGRAGTIFTHACRVDDY